MNMREKAYDAFTQNLVDRKLHPGEFVTQRSLAELTGFPLGAIREMIPRLEAEGLLRAIPQRGLQVAAVDPRLIHDAFRLREIVEVEAVAHYTRTAQDEAIQTQRDALDLIRKTAREGMSENLLAEAQAVDWGFHKGIVTSLGNRLVDDIHRVNAIRIRMIMHDRVSLVPMTLPPAMGEHMVILDAIASRDEAGAVAALREHLGRSRARALGIELGAWASHSEQGGFSHSAERERIAG